MKKFVIFEQDSQARATLTKLLAQEDLSDHCIITGDDKNPDISLWITNRDHTNINDDSLSTFYKPIRIGHILDKIKRNIAEKSQKKWKKLRNIQQYELNPEENTLKNHKKNEKIQLTDKECHILMFLYGKNGGFISKSILLDEVWGYASGIKTHTLETHIYRLRQKIEIDPANPKILITSEQGYALMA